MRTLNQRYYIEHIMLPRAFYLAPNAVLSNIREKGQEFISNCYNSVLDKDRHKIQPQFFKVNDFEIFSIMAVNGLGYSLITPPAAENVYDCQMIGVANCGRRPVYGTIERTAEGHYCLCSWDSHHNHHFYGVFRPNITWEKKSDAMQRLLLHMIAA